MNRRTSACAYAHAPVDTHRGKKVLSLLLSLALCLSLLPAPALAAEPPKINICGTTLAAGKDYAPNAGEAGGIVEKTNETSYLAYSDGVLTVNGDVTVAQTSDESSSVLELVSGDLTISIPAGGSLTLNGKTNVCLLGANSTLKLTGAGDVTIQASEVAVNGDQASGSTLAAESYSGNLTISTSMSSSKYVAVNNTTLNLDTTGNISITGCKPMTRPMTVTNAKDVTVSGNIGEVATGSSITATGNVNIETTEGMVVSNLTVKNAKKVTLTGNTTGIVTMNTTFTNCGSWNIINKNQNSTDPIAVSLTVDGTTYGACYGVTVTDDGNGTASASPAVAGSGSTVTLSAEPNSGFQFKEWQVIAGEVTIEGNQFTMPGKNVTVKAVFESAGGDVGSGIAINETNFPDQVFRDYVSTNFDKDSNGLLSATEIAAVKEVKVGSKGIATLKGIEHFPALTVLHCDHNQLTKLDVSKNTALTNLNCEKNQLTALDVGKNTELKWLECQWNQLTAMDISKNTKLTTLSCNDNQLTALNVSGDPELIRLNCNSNRLTELDVSGNPALTMLNCNSNRLTALDVSGNPALTELNCHSNQLRLLDVGGNPALTLLLCHNNQLRLLDVSSNTKLYELDCGGNQLTSLNLSGNTQLYELHADENTYQAERGDGTFDLSSLPGKFDVSKASSWTGGSVSETTLTVNSDAGKVTYSYDCGNGHTAAFTLSFGSGSSDPGDDTQYTVTAYGLYGEHTPGFVPGATMTFDAAAGEEISLIVGMRDGYTMGNVTLVGITEADLTWAGKDTEHAYRGFIFTMPANDVTVTVNWTKNGSGGGSGNEGGSGGGTGSGGSSSGGISGGGGSTSGSTTTTTTNPDGSTTTTTENKATGTVTETAKHEDGSQTVVETKTDGTVTTTETDTAGNKSETVVNPDGSSVVTVKQANGATATVNTDAWGKVEAEVTLPQETVAAAREAGSAIALPIPEVRAATSAADAPVVTVKTGSTEPVKVLIPTTEARPGTVAVLVREDGAEEVIKTSVSTENGLAVALPDGATVKIVDNSKTFADVPADNWAADAVSFSSARELFAGTSADSFSPEQPMTRAMMATVLARFDGADTRSGSTWYEQGVNWAVSRGISDGSNPNASITREQLAVMLWRYSGSPAAANKELNFTDIDEAGGWAMDALRWAVENGVMGGYGDGRLAPKGLATRAQVAQMLKNFLEGREESTE